MNTSQSGGSPRKRSKKKKRRLSDSEEAEETAGASHENVFDQQYNQPGPRLSQNLSANLIQSIHSKLGPGAGQLQGQGVIDVLRRSIDLYNQLSKNGIQAQPNAPLQTRPQISNTKTGPLNPPSPNAVPYRRTTSLTKCRKLLNSRRICPPPFGLMYPRSKSTTPQPTTLPYSQRRECACSPLTYTCSPLGQSLPYQCDNLPVAIPGAELVCLQPPNGSPTPGFSPFNQFGYIIPLPDACNGSSQAQGPKIARECQNRGIQAFQPDSRHGVQSNALPRTIPGGNPNQHGNHPDKVSVAPFAGSPADKGKQLNAFDPYAAYRQSEMRDNFSQSHEAGYGQRAAGVQVGYGGPDAYQNAQAARLFQESVGVGAGVDHACVEIQTEAVQCNQNFTMPSYGSSGCPTSMCYCHGFQDHGCVPQQAMNPMMCFCNPVAQGGMPQGMMPNGGPYGTMPQGMPQGMVQPGVQGMPPGMMPPGVQGMPHGMMPPGVQGMSQGRIPPGGPYYMPGAGPEAVPYQGRKTADLIKLKPGQSAALVNEDGEIEAMLVTTECSLQDMEEGNTKSNPTFEALNLRKLSVSPESRKQSLPRAEPPKPKLRTAANEKLGKTLTEKYKNEEVRSYKSPRNISPAPSSIPANYESKYSDHSDHEHDLTVQDVATEDEPDPPDVVRPDQEETLDHGEDEMSQGKSEDRRRDSDKSNVTSKISNSKMTEVSGSSNQRKDRQKAEPSSTEPVANSNTTPTSQRNERKRSRKRSSSSHRSSSVTAVSPKPKFSQESQRRRSKSISISTDVIREIEKARGSHTSIQNAAEAESSTPDAKTLPKQRMSSSSTSQPLPRSTNRPNKSPSEASRSKRSVSVSIAKGPSSKALPSPSVIITVRSKTDPSIVPRTSRSLQLYIMDKTPNSMDQNTVMSPSGVRMMEKSEMRYNFGYPQAKGSQYDTSGIPQGVQAHVVTGVQGIPNQSQHQFISPRYPSDYVRPRSCPSNPLMVWQPPSRCYQKRPSSARRRRSLSRTRNSQGTAKASASMCHRICIEQNLNSRTYKKKPRLETQEVMYALCPQDTPLRHHERVVADDGSHWVVEDNMPSARYKSQMSLSGGFTRQKSRKLGFPTCRKSSAWRMRNGCRNTCLPFFPPVPSVPKKRCLNYDERKRRLYPRPSCIEGFITSFGRPSSKNLERELSYMCMPNRRPGSRASFLSMHGVPIVPKCKKAPEKPRSRSRSSSACKNVRKRASERSMNSKCGESSSPAAGHRRDTCTGGCLPVSPQRYRHSCSNLTSSGRKSVGPSRPACGGCGSRSPARTSGWSPGMLENLFRRLESTIYRVCGNCSQQSPKPFVRKCTSTQVESERQVSKCLQAPQPQEALHGLGPARPSCGSMPFFSNYAPLAHQVQPMRTERVASGVKCGSRTNTVAENVLMPPAARPSNLIHANECNSKNPSQILQCLQNHGRLLSSASEHDEKHPHFLSADVAYHENSSFHRKATPFPDRRIVAALAHRPTLVQRYMMSGHHSTYYAQQQRKMSPVRQSTRNSRGSSGERKPSKKRSGSLQSQQRKSSSPGEQLSSRRSGQGVPKGHSNGGPSEPRQDMGPRPPLQMKLSKGQHLPVQTNERNSYKSLVYEDLLPHFEKPKLAAPKVSITQVSAMHSNTMRGYNPSNLKL